ncbi:MAG: hypothetical protein R8K48_01735 [Gallionella sp.]
MKALIIAALVLTPAMAMADTTVNAKISTLGGGVEVAFPIMKSVDARIGLNTFSYNFNKSSTSGVSTTNYAGKLNLQSLEALADWHPWAGSFRVSGGLIYNDNKLTLTALPGAGGTFTAGGVAHTIGAGEFVNATIGFNKIAPYLGIGWGRTPKNMGWSFTSDIGILFQGTPRVAVSTNIAGVTAADKAQANADLNSSLKRFNIYPVVSAGIGYTF